MKYHRLISISPDSDHGDEDDDEAAAHNYEMLHVMMVLMVILMMIKINKKLPFSADVANQKRGGWSPERKFVFRVEKSTGE